MEELSKCMGRSIQRKGKSPNSDTRGHCNARPSHMARVFGTPGVCNDINVLDRSPLFDRLIQGKAPQATFTINNREYDTCYFLADGIYPRWATLVQVSAIG